MFSGCATLSSAQIRQLTTRTVDADYANIFNATIAVLRDNGFLIKSTDTEVGFILAEEDKEFSRPFGFWEDLFSKGYIAHKGSVMQITAEINPLSRTQSEVHLTLKNLPYNSREITGETTDTNYGAYRAMLDRISKEALRREALRREKK